MVPPLKLVTDVLLSSLPRISVPATTVATCPRKSSVPTAVPEVPVPILLPTERSAAAPLLPPMITVPGLPAACDANLSVPLAFDRPMLTVLAAMTLALAPRMIIPAPPLLVLELPICRVVAVIALLLSSQ